MLWTYQLLANTQNNQSPWGWFLIFEEREVSLPEWGQMKSGIRLTLVYKNPGTMMITPSSISWWLLSQVSSVILEEQQGMSQMLERSLRANREVSLKTGLKALTCIIVLGNWGKKIATSLEAVWTTQWVPGRVSKPLGNKFCVSYTWKPLLFGATHHFQKHWASRTVCLAL